MTATTAAAAGAGIDPERAKDIMGSVCAPVGVVTTTEDGRTYGATVSSFAALSIEPPLITVSFERTSYLLGRIRSAGRFGVNLLGHGQDDLATTFARRGVDRFAETAWHLDSGLPRIEGAAGWLACDLYDTVEGGDHLLLFGLVTRVARVDLPPLIYAHRTFGTHSRFGDRKRPLIADVIAACSC
ncbi:flavin reductase family protein [Gordonia sp. TBRC 11910]|uniref:Flavin reductase family protein n=1 Tax=Gordonia asplenii TaxID=2725283 RepID=A0A848L7W5_9ACTN|nr:flavin reductase family protein [Gordonia asplenii]NMO03668.1 flavin reductase family protein [Gordonia asplenii]